MASNVWKVNEGKLTTEKLKSSRLSWRFVVRLPLMSFFSKISKYETDDWLWPCGIFFSSSLRYIGHSEWFRSYEYKKMGLLTTVHNWEFQQIVGSSDFQKLHRWCNQNGKHHFYIIFRESVYTIQIVFIRKILCKWPITMYVN